MKPIQVGLLGLGVVGGGTIEVLRRNREEIARRAGREIRITRRASSIGTPASSAISSTVGSRPLSCSSVREAFRRRVIVSIICTGTRIVRA